MREINLIPDYLKEKKINSRKNFLYMISIFLIIAMLFPGVIVLKRNLQTLKQEEKNLKALIKENEYVISEEDKLNKELKKYVSYKEKTDIVLSQKIIVNERIKHIERYIPKDIIFESLNYEGKSIVITGSAVKYDSIAELVANLEMTHRYNRVRINDIVSNEIIDTNKKTNYAFSITVEY